MLTRFRLDGDIYNTIYTYLTKKIDLLLLVFLLLFLNARFGLNIAAILLIFVFRRDLKVKLNGITYFYIGIVILSLISFFITDSVIGYPKLFTTLVSSVLWIFCLLSFHQLWLSVKRNSLDTILNTVKALTIINLLASLFYLVKIMVIRKTINPYLEDTAPPYGINTGDMIGGVFGGNHDVNSIICAMLFMFFMYRKDFKFAFLALLPHLLTGNNFIVILLFGYIMYMLIFSRSKLLKYYSLISIAIIVVFYVKVTTPNYYYMTQKLHIGTKSPHDYFIDKLQKNDENVSLKKTLVIDSLYRLWNVNENPRNIYAYSASDDNKMNVGKMVRQLKQEKNLKERNSMLRIRDSLLRMKRQNEPKDLIKYNLDSISGKLISFNQTKDFLSSSEKNFLIGAGPGGFSSRLAFMHSDLIGQQTRFLTWLPHYETEVFNENHKTIYQHILYLDTSYNTFSNKPFSFYNEIFGEYGIIGFIFWVLFYIGFYLKRWKHLTFTRFLLPFVLVVLATDYWYHSLTIIVVLELLALIDLKINNHQKTFERNE